MMPHFDKICNKDDVMDSKKLMQCLIELAQLKEKDWTLNMCPTSENEYVNFDGKRVTAYIKIAKHVININYLRIITAGAFCKSNNSLKFVNFMPEK